MIGRIIAFSAKHSLFVVLAATAAAILAWTLLGSIRLDALPDLSDTQVIVLTRWDRSPDIIEDQVTYPVVTALMGAPRVEAVRGMTDFGFSFVTVIFEDGVDLYWARSRVTEYLAGIRARLPAGVVPEIGPDATGVGWVFQYALVDRTGRNTPESLRSIQDWTLRYALQAVPGVAEVASVGGFVRQYQITVDPVRMQASGITLDEIAAKVRASNDEVGGRLIEMGGVEIMVRGRGYATDPADFERIVLRGEGSRPLLLGDVATVTIGPEMRRGVADLDGGGDAVGGIVVMRHGENALQVIRRVKTVLADLEAGLPEGVSIVTAYDRSDLIERALKTLRHEITLQIVIVSLVIIFFLWHLPSAFVPILSIPVSVLLAFIPLYLLGVTVNIMSLAGIAISIGVLVDGAIVEVENVHNRIHLWRASGGRGDASAVRLQALQEVGPPVFFSLLIIAVAFTPIFALEGQEGRLFRPLAHSKNMTMLVAALLAITLVPALRSLLTRTEPYTFRPAPLSRLASLVMVGSYRGEDRHPASRAIASVYLPVCRFVLRRPGAVVAVAAALVVAALPIYFALGSEFMPDLEEGTILYMPTTLPGISVSQAQELLATQDRVLMEFPEVERVFGKAGRADTATDPAPLSMIETTIVLKPVSEWRTRERWYSSWVPGFAQAALRPFWPDRISRRELTDLMDRALRIPGVSNAWTMPIRGRIDMLKTGIPTPVGIKVLGPDPAAIERIGARVEETLLGIPGVRSAYAERTAGGYFLDVEPKRDVMARLGVSIEQVQSAVMSAIGGENITWTIEGRERYPVNLRYPRELRDDPDRLERVLVATERGTQIPLGHVADLRLVEGPAMLRDESGFLAGYVYVNVEGRDLGGFVEEARAAVEESVKMPPGYRLVWSGHFEALQSFRSRLRLLIPLTLGLIFILLLACTRSPFKASLVMLAVPFSAIGALLLFFILGYEVSAAAWVGVIALLGLDVETGIFMLLFLDLSCDRARAEGRLANEADLDAALVAGAVKRVRPKLMTVSAALMGLLPIMWSASAGADIMRMIAAPMIGGLVTSFLLELTVYPAAYKLRAMRSHDFTVA